MPNDAKLGLVIGVGLVLAVGIIFFRRDAAAQAPTPARPAALATQDATPTTPDANLAVSDHGEVEGQPTGRTIRPAGRRHKVEEGDTLTGLAERYLGDGDRANEIYEANRTVLSSPDDLPVGTELVIPEREHASAVKDDDP